MKYQFSFHGLATGLLIGSLIILGACNKTDINPHYRMDLNKHIQYFEPGMDFEQVKSELGEPDDTFFGTGGAGEATYGDSLRFGLNTDVWSVPPYLTSITASGSYSGQSKEKISLGTSRESVHEVLGTSDGVVENDQNPFPLYEQYLRSDHILKLFYRSDSLKQITLGFKR